MILHIIEAVAVVLIVLLMMWIIQMVTVSCVVGFYPAKWVCIKHNGTYTLMHNGLKETYCCDEIDYALDCEIDITDKWYRFLIKL